MSSVGLILALICHPYKSDNGRQPRCGVGPFCPRPGRLVIPRQRFVGSLKKPGRNDSVVGFAIGGGGRCWDARSGISWSSSSLARYDSSFLMTVCSCASIVFSTFRGCEMKSPTCCLDDGQPHLSICDRLPVLGEMLGRAPGQRLRGQRGVVRATGAHHRGAEDTEVWHLV